MTFFQNDKSCVVLLVSVRTVVVMLQDISRCISPPERWWRCSNSIFSKPRALFSLHRTMCHWKGLVEIDLSWDRNARSGRAESSFSRKSSLTGWLIYGVNSRRVMQVLGLVPSVVNERYCIGWRCLRILAVGSQGSSVCQLSILLLDSFIFCAVGIFPRNCTNTVQLRSD